MAGPWEHGHKPALPDATAPWCAAPVRLCHITDFTKGFAASPRCFGKVFSWLRRCFHPSRAGKHSTAQYSSSARLAARHAPPQWTSTIYIVNEKSWRAENSTACLQRGRSYVRKAKNRSIPTEQSGSIFQREMRPHGRVESSPLLSCRLPLTDGGRHGGGRRRRGAAVRGPLRTSG